MPTPSFLADVELLRHPVAAVSARTIGAARVFNRAEKRSLCERRRLFSLRGCFGRRESDGGLDAEVSET
jgi:hypothetical protein